MSFHLLLDKDDQGTQVKIDRISGPISIRILHPLQQGLNQRYLTVEEKILRDKTKYLFDINHKQLPKIILLGDDHFNAHHQCTDCTCKSTDSSCCVHIFQDPFFTFLNQTVKNCSKQHQVDVYIESNQPLLTEPEVDKIINDPAYLSSFKSRLQNNPNSADVNLSGINLHHINVQGCYDRQIQALDNDVYQQICQAPDLNWRYADPRTINYTNPDETFVLESLIHNCWNYNMFGRLIEPFFTNSPYTFDRTFLDEEIINKYLLPNCMYNRDFLIAYCGCLSMLYKPYYMHTCIHEMLTNPILTKHSMIYKQLHKMNDEVRESAIYFIQSFLVNRFIPKLYLKINRTFFNSQYHQYYIDNVKEVEKWKLYKVYIDNMFQSYSDLFACLQQYMQTPTNEQFDIVHQGAKKLFRPYVDGVEYPGEMLNYMNAVSFYIVLPLQDLQKMLCSYFIEFDILFKILYRSDTSKMCIMYLGEEHCSNLEDILRKYFNYYVFKIIEDQPASSSTFRCIDLTRIKGEHYDFKEELLDEN